MKETNAHTPGPWHVNKAGGISGDGEVIVINDPQTAIEADQNAINDGFGNAKANAKLIAAAPELLDACKRALDRLNAANQDRGKRAGQFMVSDIESAIAKARGVA